MNKMIKWSLVYSVVMMLAFSAAAFAQDTTVNVSGAKVDVVAPGGNVSIDEDGTKVEASEESEKKTEDQDGYETEVKAGDTEVKTK